ncbi:hypothetical protein SAMD00019534_113360, partial [Acytostelium subglobosum LB1]|uniref:hypothetical protein n=1 Tax=Acytostelium subglobosum LB1 TaxID=1410327 RepID=UPI0006448DC3
MVGAETPTSKGHDFLGVGQSLEALPLGHHGGIDVDPHARVYHGKGKVHVRVALDVDVLDASCRAWIVGCTGLVATELRGDATPSPSTTTCFEWTWDTGSVASGNEATLGIGHFSWHWWCSWTNTHGQSYLQT